MTKLPRPLHPFWLDATMHGESVLFVRPPSGGPPQATLMFTPLDVPALVSCTDEKAYAPQRDFIWTPGSRRITLTDDSRIVSMTDAQLYPPRGSQKHGTCRDREADLLFAETTEFHRAQTAVTYTHARDGWHTTSAPMPTIPLPRLTARLQAQSPLRIVLLGDSISAGANASAMYNAPPNQPSYGPLVADALRSAFGAPITFTNLSVGGKDALWGTEQTSAVNALNPDLFIVAFGMNDASARKPPERFIEQVSRQINDVRDEHPQAEFLVIAGMTGNPQWTATHEAFYPLYRHALHALQQQGVAMADVLSVWQALVARKQYLDLSGNGLNHPNDFGHRVYAMVVLNALLGGSGGLS